MYQKFHSLKAFVLTVGLVIFLISCGQETPQSIEGAGEGSAVRMVMPGGGAPAAISIIPNGLAMKDKWCSTSPNNNPIIRASMCDQAKLSALANFDYEVTQFDGTVTKKDPKTCNGRGTTSNPVRSQIVLTCALISVSNKCYQRATAPAVKVSCK